MPLQYIYDLLPYLLQHSTAASLPINSVICKLVQRGFTERAAVESVPYILVYRVADELNTNSTEHFKFVVLYIESLTIQTENIVVMASRLRG
jgi:hypothetical protein